MNKDRENFMCSMIENTIKCHGENNPKKHADISMILLLTFEASVRYDQKIKCASAIENAVENDLFLIQRVMEAEQ